jgi:hypothetical protein
MGPNEEDNKCSDYSSISLPANLWLFGSPYATALGCGVVVTGILILATKSKIVEKKNEII